LQAMKDWRELKPELFRKQPYYLLGGGVSKSCWREGLKRAAA
jgi:hypothetical protein